MRCYECDSRYCGATCSATEPDFGYVPGMGWRHIDICWEQYQQGRSVEWPQSPYWGNGQAGWMPVRDTPSG